MKNRIKKAFAFRIPIAMLLFLVVMDMLSVRCRENVYKDEDLASNIVTTEEKVADENTEEGKLIIEYNQFYSAGEYEFTFYGENQNEKNVVVIYSKEERPDYIETAYVPGEPIHLTLLENDSKLRFCVKYNGEGTCSVEKVVIKKQLSAEKRNLLIFLNIMWLLMVGYICLYVKRNARKPWAEFPVVLGFFLCVSVVQTFLLDLIAQGNGPGNYLNRVNHWVQSRDYMVLFLLNVLLVFAIHLIVYGIVRRAGISLIISSVVLWFGAEVCLNYYLMRGEVFNLTQLQLTGEAAQVIEGFSIAFPWALIGWMSTVTIVGALCLPWKHFGLWNAIGVLPVLAGVALVLGIYFHLDELLVPMEKYSVFTVNTYYQDVGNALGIVRTAPRKVEAPEGYNRSTIEAIVSDYEGKKSEEQTPDIIFIQCESLFDMSLITDSYWSENPLEGLYELDDEENTQVTYMLSPMTGGGTCNVEYEALTGYSVSNTSGTPFIDMISKDMPSMVSILEDLGYATTAIHTNTGNFFNRRSVYTMLGFDKIEFSEEFEAAGVVSEEDKIGVWYDDEAAYKLLIDDYEHKDESKPYFAHVVTTQNHGPYTTEYDGGVTVDADMSDDANQQLQNYLNLSKLSVESIKELLAYFDQSNRDVILVFWGDHCPGYGQFNMATSGAMGEMKSHYTPLMIWNNFGLKTQWPDLVATYQVPECLCRDLGIYSDSYMNYMMENQAPTVLGNAVFIDSETVTDTSVWDESQISVWNNLWLLQYDRMFGKKYSVSE